MKPDVKKMLYAYKHAARDLYEYFDCPYTYLDITDETDAEWGFNRDSVGWGTITDAGPIFIQTYRKVYPKDDFTMVVYHTSTGDGDAILVFDNDKKTNWDEDTEEWLISKTS
jgi:hypothetical protein